jgi:hypothetical protein
MCLQVRDGLVKLKSLLNGEDWDAISWCKENRQFLFGILIFKLNKLKVGGVTIYVTIGGCFESEFKGCFEI